MEIGKTIRRNILHNVVYDLILLRMWGETMNLVETKQRHDICNSIMLSVDISIDKSLWY